jgi:hypothetical protein
MPSQRRAEQAAHLPLGKRGAMGEGVVALTAYRVENGSSSLGEKGDVFPHGRAEQGKQGVAVAEHGGGAIHFEADHFPVILITMSFAELVFGDGEPLHRFPGEVDAIAFQQIAVNILPEIGQLEGAARFIRQALAFGIAVATHVQNEPADRIGASPAIIEQLVKGIVSGHALILFEGIDKVQKWLDGQIMAANGGCERHEQGCIGLAGEAGVCLLLQVGQAIQRLVGVAHFIADIIGHAAERIDIAEILPQMTGQKDGDDGEVLVMGVG